MPTAPPSERPTNEKRPLPTRLSTAAREIAHVAARRASARRRGPGARCDDIEAAAAPRAARSHIALVEPSEPDRTTVSFAVEARARDRRTRPPSRGSPPARAASAETLRLGHRLRRGCSPASARVDLDPLERRAQRRAPRRRVTRALRQRRPLRVPRADRTLVLVPDARSRRRRRANVPRARARDTARPGSACAASSRSRRPRLRDLADLRLREQRDVERDLRADARGDRERGAELGDREAARVPGQTAPAGRARRVQRAAPRGRRRRARRASRPRRRAAPAGAPASAARACDEPDEPVRRLRAERRRHRLLQERPRRPSRSRDARRRAGRSVGDAVELARRRARVASRATSIAGRVEDVLAGRAAVRTVLADRSRSARTSGSTGIAGGATVRGERRPVEAVGGEARRRSRAATARARERALGRRASPRATRRPTTAVPQLVRDEDQREVKRRRTPSAGRPASGCRSGAAVAGSATSVARSPRQRARRVGGVRLARREVDPRQLVPQQPAREDDDVEVRRLVRVRLRDDEREARRRRRCRTGPSGGSSRPRSRSCRRATGSPRRRAAGPISCIAPGRRGGTSSFSGRRQRPIA